MSFHLDAISDMIRLNLNECLYLGGADGVKLFLDWDLNRARCYLRNNQFKFVPKI